MNNFKDVPVDPDTSIIEQSEATINGTPVLLQKWNWDGIKAKSLIFHSKDVEVLSDNELLETIKKYGIQINSSVTFKRNDKFTFINFNFETS